MIKFKKTISFLWNNELVNTSFYTGIGSIITLVSGFIVQKVIAILVGPTGIASISQFNNFITISTSLATGGVQEGVVKYVAENRDNEQERNIYISSALRLVVTSALIVGSVIIFSATKISTILFHSSKYGYILLLFGFTVVLFGLNRLLMSILNGTGEIKKLVFVNISISLFGLFFIVVSTYFYGLEGALLAMSISQSVVFFISLILVLKSKWFTKNIIIAKVQKEKVQKLLKYSLMAFTSLIIPPLVQIGIRNYIIVNLSLSQAGLWDAMWKISTAYLGVITTTLSIYYLPKLSSLSDKLEIRKEIFNGFKIILPVLFLIISVIFFLKDYIIILLYTRKFTAMHNLFAPQLIGDFLKIASWIIAFLMLAKARTKLFIYSQLFFSIFTYLLSINFIDYFGLQGVVLAHAVKYFFYLIVMIYYFKDYLIK